ncbi:hypothetical protein H5410_064490 [Solanum commersonii]|uniref:DUF4283 domain-containing protein n=1 Tax=Solanum commersonii TaxID=4109 RepID=A0A9J5VZ99_SOLCO|nr:hypothetical protein H5410_064490 [Solanum commersonii]
MATSPSPQPMVVGETNVKPNTGRTFALSISGNQQSTEKSLKSVSLLHGEPTVVFDSKDLETFITEENLKFALITKFSHGRPELSDLRKILPQQLGFKGECNIGLLESRHVLLWFTLKEDYIAIFSKTSRSIKFAGKKPPLQWHGFPSQVYHVNILLVMHHFRWLQAVGQPLDVDRAINDKTRPSTARGKVEVDLLRTLPKRIRVQIKNLATDEITNVWQKIRGIENHIEGEKFRGDLRVHLNAKKADSNRLEVGEKDDEGTVKDLQIGAEKSGVQDQNLVRQNSGQCLGKAVLDDYSSGNRMLSLIPQTDEFSRKKTSPNQQSCNSADRIEVEEQLVVDTNQSNDAQFGAKN